MSEYDVGYDTDVSESSKGGDGGGRRKRRSEASKVTTELCSSTSPRPNIMKRTLSRPTYPSDKRRMKTRDEIGYDHDVDFALGTKDEEGSFSSATTANGDTAAITVPALSTCTDIVPYHGLYLTLKVENSLFSCNPKNASGGELAFHRTQSARNVADSSSPSTCIVPFLTTTTTRRATPLLLVDDASKKKAEESRGGTKCRDVRTKEAESIATNDTKTNRMAEAYVSNIMDID